MKSFFILNEGDDKIGKSRLTRAIAESIFGFPEQLYKINARGNNEETPPSKIVENAMKTYHQGDIDQGDPQFMKFLSDGFQSGKIRRNG
uniref:Uncharacterized protein n=1 Tax=Cucumis melo TaxID=3656 RepID=A0A9I9E971_CUCME